jgi:formylglycine-generating enzyme required for sulfatase activity
MGSPQIETGHENDEVLHQVTLSQGFWMSKYEVTQALWTALEGKSNPSDFVDPANPVDSVSWEDAQDFLILLNATTAGSTYRLPTEAEWEYACRAGTTTRYYWGEDPTDTLIDAYAWYDTNASSATRHVGEKLPNAWGLCDMAGNVDEWCQDFYDEYPDGPATDPQGPATFPGATPFQVLRGGRWTNTAPNCRSAARNDAHTGQVYNGIGFRLVRTHD